MAPQTSIPPAANVLGTIGTGICWCVQILPQIWHNWHRKSTDGLPSLMLMLWASCAVPFGVYAIVENFNIALQVQPQCFGGLTLIAWGQSLYYHGHWRAWTATLTTILVAIGFAVTETILILTLRGPYYRGVEWPMMMMAIIASVMLAVGLIPPYFELAKRNGRVIGINFVFLTVDWAGAFFSLMALVAQETFDVLGGSLYIVCMSLELGIFISQIIWLWRVRHVRRAAKQAGMSYDEYIAANPSKKLSRFESTETVSDVEACHAETVTPIEKCIMKPNGTSLGADMTEVLVPDNNTPASHQKLEKVARPARPGLAVM
ncbi:PQ-loop-domain-containing protein [Pleomassaria siparia CBS 279.74]|uniref:PQ-loop-domain-containing protein n=1 Tax=Pleomassaria siparia CBS 279.74 TaxID=1314801 RepID=A0A6G1JTW6_9PLEO|nr:PQ-loop-domain-containing protein [Pleomassaria siparia CBS 279.74]